MPSDRPDRPDPSPEAGGAAGDPEPIAPDDARAPSPGDAAEAGEARVPGPGDAGEPTHAAGGGADRAEATMLAALGARLRLTGERLRTWRIGLWLKRSAIALTIATGLGLFAIALLIRHYEADLPSTAELRSYHPPQVTRVLARDGTLLGEIFVERRTLVPIASIPAELKLAVLAAEDAKFYEHAGLNYVGMLRALAVNLRSSKSRQGGSTITQQVIKNLLLSPERTYERKIREVLLARRLEQELSKDEILELYLNHIYFGHGRYGVEEAARYYFGKPVGKVTLGEAALIAGLPKGPGVYSPRVDMTRAAERRAFVLDQMVQKGFATAAQAEAARNEPIVLAAEAEALPELAPEVVEEVRRTLREIVGPAADKGGYTITTTIDPSTQAAARSAVRKNLDDYAKRHKLLAPLTLGKKPREPAPFQGTPKAGGGKVYLGVVTATDDVKGTLTVKVGTAEGTVEIRDAARYNPKGLLPSQLVEVGKVVRVSVLGAEPARPGAGDDAPPDDPKPPRRLRLHLELGPEGALVAVDVRTREVLALVGSYEAVRAGLDRATQAHRQPGSTFKPFVYSYALHARTMTPATILETNPKAIAGYELDNYDESEGEQPARLREALAHSVNVAAVWTLERVGPTNVVAWAHALGIESKLDPTRSLALGAYEVTPRELTAAYATFAAGGVYEAPVLVQRITGPNGVEIALPPRPPPRRVMDEAEAYVVTSLLTSVVDTGTGKRAKALGRPIAGKTGTSNKAKDAWFAGYSTDIACVVWTGYDDATPLGAGEAGATAALPAFVDFMRQAHGKRPVADFPLPAGVTRVAIDPRSGLRAYPEQEDAFDEVFLAGTEPSEVASPDAGADGAAVDPDAGGEPAASPGAPGADPAAAPAPAPPGEGDPGAVPAPGEADPAAEPPPF